MDYSLLVGIEEIKDSQKYRERFSSTKELLKIGSVAGNEQLTDSVSYLENEIIFQAKSRAFTVFDKAGYHVHRF